MTTPENTQQNPDTPDKLTTVADAPVEQYDPSATANVSDSHNDLTLPHEPSTFEQPKTGFPGYDERLQLHDDTSHRRQLIDEARAGMRDLGLPADSDPAAVAMVAYATFPPEAVDAAITRDYRDNDADAARSQTDSTRGLTGHLGLEHLPSTPVSELHAASKAIDKKGRPKRIAAAVGAGAAFWVLTKYGAPATFGGFGPWIVGASTAFTGYVGRELSSRQRQRIAQKEVKKLQKEQQQRAES